MKTKISHGLLMLLTLGFSVFAQDVKTEKFEVSGNCGMCKARIEKAGHDTDMHKASDDVYDKLPGCCKYYREVKKDADDQVSYEEKH